VVTGLIVAFIVLVVLAVVAAAGYVIDRSVPEDGDEAPLPR
jgi:Na+-transporting methylmalonyl-CoA/oxaloacetate decarboxylase gamma subunit